MRGEQRGRSTSHRSRKALLAATGACVGGTSCSTSSSCTSAYSGVRNQFGSGGGNGRSGAGVQPRRGDHPAPDEHRPLLRGQPPALVPRPAAARADPVLEHLLRAVPLRRGRLRPGVDVPQGTAALPPVAQHPRLHHAARPGGLRRRSRSCHRACWTIPGSTAAARSTPPAESLPDEDGEPPCDRYGFVDTVAVYGGWASFGSEEMAAVSNQYAAMPSMHIGWSTWCALVLAPLVRRRWLRALVIAYPFFTLFDIMVTAQPLLDRRRGRAHLPRRRLPDRPRRHQRGGSHAKGFRGR